MTATFLPFLVATDVTKPDPELRKFIRSHVMLGKNRGKTRLTRESRKTAHKTKAKVRDAAIRYKSDEIRKSCHEELYSDTRGKLKANEDVLSTLDSTCLAVDTTHELDLPLTIPRKFGWIMAPTAFAVAVESATVESFLQFSSFAKRLLFPLEPCLFFERRAEAWIIPLTTDAAFLHTMMFTTQCYFNAVASRKNAPMSLSTMHHYLQALKLLQERMSRIGDQAAFSDTTIAAVMSLAGHALVAGDFASATNHLHGVRRISNLRGGTETFHSNPKLLVEILRCDLGLVLHQGTQPIFFNPLGPKDVPYPDLTPLLKLCKAPEDSPSGRESYLPSNIDSSIRTAWDLLSTFCTVVNFAITTQQRLPMDVYLSTMAAVMYRLMHTSSDPPSADAAIRLGLLAFAASIFLQWKTSFSVSYQHLAVDFRICIEGLQPECVASELRLWLLVVGGATLFDAGNDAWLLPLLADSLRDCDVASWEQLRELMGDVMWVGLVHDQAGRRVFRLATANASIATGEYTRAAILSFKQV